MSSTEVVRGDKPGIIVVCTRKACKQFGIEREAILPYIGHRLSLAPHIICLDCQSTTIPAAEAKLEQASASRLR